MEEKNNFENLKKFFENDIKVKDTILRLAPNELDDYNEESRIEYTDKLYKEINNIEAHFTKTIENFEFDLKTKEVLKEKFEEIKSSFLIGKYEYGKIKDSYRKNFSNMDQKLIEKVKETCVGETFYKDEIPELINKANSINELLHVIHSAITNDEEILQSMPVIDSKINKCKEKITLYGEETEIARKIFEDFPLELNCGCTEIVSMKNKTLMMIRDIGHALTINIDTVKENELFVEYFVPKLSNREMIEALPGINKSSITNNGAKGMFEIKKEEISKKLFDFIEKVPTDADLPEPDYMKAYNNEQKTKNEINYVFKIEDAKELATEQNEKGRRIGAITFLQNKLKEAKDKIIGKITGEKLGGKTNDEPTRD